MGSHEGLRGVFPGQRTWESLLAVAWPHRFSASWQSLLGMRSGRVRVSPSLMASRRFSLHQSTDWRKRRSAGMASPLDPLHIHHPGVMQICAGLIAAEIAWKISPDFGDFFQKIDPENKKQILGASLEARKQSRKIAF